MAGFVEKLNELLERATPGKWTEDDGFLHSEPLLRKVDEWIAVRMGKGYTPFSRPETVVAQCSQDLPNFQADADLIVYLVNRAPAIAALVEAAEHHSCNWKIGHPLVHGPCPICESLRALDSPTS